jgi:mRNA interferase MazF
MRWPSGVRGDLFRLRPSTRRGHQQAGARYGVVLQTDDLSVLSTVIVAPTSTSARPAVFRPAITLGGVQTLVLLEQAAAVDRETELGEFAGRLDPSELAEVDAMLRYVLGLFD